MINPGPSSSVERVPTGVPGLDVLLHGGFLRGDVYLLEGPPGSGKTILVSQIGFHHVAQGGRVVYVTLLAENHARMLSHLQSLQFFDPAVIGDALYYISAYRDLEQGGLPALLELLRQGVRDHRATLLVLDGVASVKAYAGSDLAFKQFIHQLHAHIEAAGCTAFLLTESHDNVLHPEYSMVDGIIHMTEHQVDLRSERELAVLKFRGSGHLRGRHAFQITDAGIVIHPRTEARYASPFISANGSRGQLAFGIARLDEMLRGGLYADSMTMLLGSTGSGKTLLGLQFLVHGAQAGEPGLYFGFNETPPRLLSKAAQINLDLAGYVERGMIETIWQPPIEHLLDDLAERLLEAVQRRQVRRLFIDGLGGFEEATMYPRRLGRFLSALTNQFRRLGVTALFAQETRRLFGPEIEIPLGRVSGICDNVIFLRYVELRSRLHRFLSILKVRESGYEPAIREFQITDQGIDIGPTFEAAESILSGLGHPLRHRRALVPRVRPGRGQEGTGMK